MPAKFLAAFFDTFIPFLRGIRDAAGGRPGRKPAKNTVLERIKDLIRRCDGLPDNVSETEIKHYALELLRRMKRGEDVHALARYLARLTGTSGRQYTVPTAAHELAQQAIAVFRQAR